MIAICFAAQLTIERLAHRRSDNVNDDDAEVGAHQANNASAEQRRTNQEDDRHSQFEDQ